LGEYRTTAEKVDAEMNRTRANRREYLKSAAATATAAVIFPKYARSQIVSPRVVVIGGGFGGATCARALIRANAQIAVTLVEANRTFTACPMSNAVIAGLRAPNLHQFGYDKIAAEGVTLAFSAATAVDSQGRTVTLADGSKLAYDRLVLAPGIDFRWNSLPGYDEAAAEKIPHAWKGGKQILLLRKQLEAMSDGGIVVISVPVNPARCPPAPYERASLIAHFLKTRKPRSKVIVLDAKDSFSMQRLFLSAWKDLYPEMLEWVPLSKGGNLASVDVANKTLATDFDSFKAAVANIIPPQKAGKIAELAGVADRTGWCPIDPTTFESKLQPNIHVIGDAAISGAMPKSATAANSEARICALAVAALLAGKSPGEPKLVSTCYSLLAPDYAISIEGHYHRVNDQFLEIEGIGGTSPLDAPPSVRAREAMAADGLFDSLTGEVYG
jgi:NADPH-dependent 2,4-dienoyl-CoA reductase/sulfur reductase-like enzyme